MKKISVSFILSLILSMALSAQPGVDKVLSEIEKNNKTLTTLRQSVEAEKLINKTGINPVDPELGFNYLWGDPSGIGNRKDINIIQSFDFPGTYFSRHRISENRNIQADLEFLKQKKSLLLRSKLICMDLIYYHAMYSELLKRKTHAMKIASAYDAMLQAGQTNILESNKTQLVLLNLTTELESVRIERDALLNELTALNGGITISFSDSIFQLPEIPPDFEQWYVQVEPGIPELQWMQKEIEIRQKQERLSVALCLPKMQAGYMSENVVGEKFSGVTAGITIPLWENRNTIRYSKAHTMAGMSLETEYKQKFYNELKTLYTKAAGIRKNLDKYLSVMPGLDLSDLLAKALNKGEISLTEYFFELSVYYVTVNNMLGMQRDLNKTVSELNQYN